MTRDHKISTTTAMSATSDWVTPPTRPALIESLVSGVGLCQFELPYLNDAEMFTDRYNPSNVGILEDYLYHQIRSREYDCLANLAILKLFAFLSFLFTGAHTGSPFFQIPVQSRSVQSRCCRKHLGESSRIRSVSRLQSFCR